MCLFIKGKDYKVAKEDITAYAVRVYYGSEICSPVKQQCVWELGERKSIEDDCHVYDMSESINTPTNEKDIAVCLENDYQYVIADGMFHLFKHLSDAKNVYEFLKEELLKGGYRESGVLLAEHVIPAGSKYYEGSNGTFLTSTDDHLSSPTMGYATNTTVFTKILESFNPEQIESLPDQN